MNALGKTLATVGVCTVAEIAALNDQPDTSSHMVADPPLPRERECVLHTPVEQVVETRIVQHKPDLGPFSEPEICRATLATMHSRDPSAYRVSASSGEATWFEFVRRDDGKRFSYGCRVELGEVRIQIGALQRWNENTRYFYRLSADRKQVEIEGWLMPSAEQRQIMKRMGMEPRDELLERQTFNKKQLAG